MKYRSASDVILLSSVLSSALVCQVHTVYSSPACQQAKESTLLMNIKCFLCISFGQTRQDYCRYFNNIKNCQNEKRYLLLDCLIWAKVLHPWAVVQFLGPIVPRLLSDVPEVLSDCIRNQDPSGTRSHPGADDTIASIIDHRVDLAQLLFNSSQGGFQGGRIGHISCKGKGASVFSCCSIRSSILVVLLIKATFQ